MTYVLQTVLTIIPTPQRVPEHHKKIILMYTILKYASLL